jgi:VanZ family protein
MLFLASGIAGMLFFSTVDFVRPGVPKFGTNQLAGFVISTIIVLAGVHNTTSQRAKTRFGALLLLYLAGILFMGLKPSGHFSHPIFFHNYYSNILIIAKPPIKDFIINILGFCPFAYLFMAYLVAGKQAIRWIMPVCLVLLAGVGASLCIEIVQFYIPGRTSSMMDLIANTAGTMIGITYFIVEKNTLKLSH